ncbi:MAG: hypothetical protein WCV88_02730 [Patescibacteria group bacterium]|jgi:hypothetical protein
MNVQLNDPTFDELCEKIAQGKATPSDMEAAFKSLNSDIDAFSADVQDQLYKNKK